MRKSQDSTPSVRAHRGADPMFERRSLLEGRYKGSKEPRPVDANLSVFNASSWGDLLAYIDRPDDGIHAGRVASVTVTAVTHCNVDDVAGT